MSAPVVGVVMGSDSDWPVMEAAALALEEMGIAYEADVVLHLTEWSVYREIDPAKLGTVVARKAVIDGRNALDPQLWREAGWTYRALGRPSS